MRKERGFIGVDFDGTLATYDKYRGPTVLGEPIEAMTKRVRRWLHQGKLVKIFTARVAPDHSEEEIAEGTKAIQAWCKEHLGQELEVTAIKSRKMYEFWDDKAIGVEKNTGKILTGNE